MKGFLLTFGDSVKAFVGTFRNSGKMSGNISNHLDGGVTISMTK
jgi:hypothetical protein